MSHTKKIALTLLAAVILAWFAPALPVFAQDYIPLAPITGEGIAPADQFTSCQPRPIYNVAGELTNEADLCLPKYLRTLYNIGIALAGLFLVFSIVRGGFTLMFTDSVLNRMEGKKIILQAMGGAVIVFSSYLFLNMINPELAGRLNLSLKFPSITIQEFASDLKTVRWSAIAIADAEKVARERSVALQTQRKNLEDRAILLRMEAAALPDGDVLGDALLEEAAYYEDEAEKLKLAEVTTIIEPLTSVKLANANSREELDTAMKQAGENIEKIRDAFGSARDRFASNPEMILALRREEVQRISTIEKSAAFGMLDNPVMQDKKLMAGLTNDAVQTQMNKIVNQKARTLEALRVLETSNPGLKDKIDVERAMAEKIANGEICQIKEKCKATHFECSRLYSNISCAGLQ